MDEIDVILIAKWSLDEIDYYSVKQLLDNDEGVKLPPLWTSKISSILRIKKISSLNAL